MTTDTGTTLKAGVALSRGPGFCLSGPGPSLTNDCGGVLSDGAQEQGSPSRFDSGLVAVSCSESRRCEPGPQSPSILCTFCREPIDLPAGMLGPVFLGPRRAGLPCCELCACRWDADMDRAEQRMARQKAMAS